MMFVENDIACDYTKKYPNRAKKNVIQNQKCQKYVRRF
ncbi:Hypothetical protein BN2458_PEG1204 [Helicobacter typhlonius]|uniref:Uncharacterized protein n=1 Tax=Helicobacter typhlonius TaxID=76936 RepID=A0A0S4PV19_9HELI|nr:Hypothetical protein BN2458_PEG1204 [Helicobacter typhlonius]